MVKCRDLYCQVRKSKVKFTVVWFVMLSHLVARQQPFRKTCCLYLECRRECHKTCHSKQASWICYHKKRAVLSGRAPRICPHFTCRTGGW